MKHKEQLPVIVEFPEIEERVLNFTHVSKPLKVEAFQYKGDINDALLKLGFITSISVDMSFKTPENFGSIHGKAIHVFINDYVVIQNNEVSTKTESEFLELYETI
jgi:hypothetical protein